MKKIQYFIFTLLVITISGCGDLGDELEDYDEPFCSSYSESCQYEYLDAIAGRTLTFKYGSYVDTVKMGTTIYVPNNANDIAYFSRGSLTENGVTYDVDCISIRNVYILNHYSPTPSEDYFCSWFYANGDQNAYLFSISSLNSISGDFTYADNSTNILTEILYNPDTSVLSGSEFASVVNFSNATQSIDKKLMLENHLISTNQEDILQDIMNEISTQVVDK